MKTNRWLKIALLGGFALSCSGEDAPDTGAQADQGAPADLGQMTQDSGQVAQDLGAADQGSVDIGPADLGDPDMGAPDSGEVTGIPVPPMTAAFDWADTEPNNTPQQAQAIGTFEFALWMGFGAVPNSINANDDVDYYVFRAPDADGLANLFPEGFTVFWNAQINLLDMRLYEVNNGTLGAMVREAATDTIGQENLMEGTTPAEVLTPGGIYLLEIAAAPGLDLGGNPESYSA